MTSTATRPGGGGARAAISARTLRTDRWWLAPLSFLYGVVMALRGFLYRIGLRHRTRLPVPVVVVGNLTVGGTG